MNDLDIAKLAVRYGRRVPIRAAKRERRRLVSAWLASHTLSMPQFGLTDDEREALAALLRETIAADRFPLSPRMRTLKTILAKLDPAEKPPVDPLPPPKPTGRRSAGLATRSG